MLSIIALLGISRLSFGQASRYDWTVSTINQSAPQPGGMYPVLNIPGSAVQICNSPANAVPCTNYAVTYEDAAQSATCSAPTQLTRPGTNVCVAGADAQGGFGLWIASGNYQYTVTTTYGSFGPYDFSVGGVGGAANPAGPAFAVNFANSAVTQFQGDPSITINPTTHNLAIQGFNALTTLTGQAQVNTVTVSEEGGVADAVQVTDLTCTGGSTTVTTTASAPFTGSAGKAIVLPPGCGTPLTAFRNFFNALVPMSFATTIVSGSGNTATLATAPPVITGSLTSVSYVSGLTVTGTAAGSCPLTAFNNGSTATGLLEIAAGFPSTISGVVITSIGSGATSPPTTATIGSCSGGVTVSGTPVFTSSLGASAVTGWAAIGTDNTAAVQACVNAANPNGRCTINNGKSFLMSSSGNMNMSVGSGETIDGTGTLIYAPQSSVPVSELTNALIFQVISTITGANCASTGAAVCQIAAAIPAGQNFFTATSASDAASLIPGQWIMIQETDSVERDVFYFDWAQVLSVSGTQVNLMSPTRMSWPDTHTWVPPGTFGGLGWRRVTALNEHAALRDFNLIVPALASGGQEIAPVYTIGAKDFHINNWHCTAAETSCMEEEYDKGDVFTDNTENHGAPDEYSKATDGFYEHNIYDHPSLPINGNLSACQQWSGGGIELDLALGFFTFSNNSFPNLCSGGIAAFFGVHDGIISGNKVGWINAGSGSEAVGLSFDGGYNNFAQGNTFAGADGSMSNIVSSGNSGGNPGVMSDSNDVRNQRACLVQGASNCFQGTQYRMVGTLNTDIYDYQTPGGNSYNHPYMQNFLAGAAFGSTTFVLNTQFTLLGNSTSGLGHTIGSPTTIQDWEGSLFSSGGTVSAFNAIQVSGGNWYTNDASFATSAITENPTGLSYYSAAAGTCSSNSASPSTFGACFGTTPRFTVAAATGVATFSGAIQAGSLINLNGTANPLDLNGSPGTSGQVLTSQGPGATPIWAAAGSGSGVTSIDTLTGAFTFTGPGVSHTGNAYTFSGTGSGVTSVALTTPSWLTVAGSPITSSGTLAITGTSEAANLFLASPNGSAGAMAPRAIVAGDIPTLNQSTSGNAATATALAATPSQCSGSQFSTGIAASGNANCATPAGAVASVTNSDSSLTITPTTGAVVASLNTAHANSWSGAQTFTGSGIPIATGTTSNTDLAGFITLSGGTGTYSFTATHVTNPVCTATDTTAVAAVQAVATTTVLTVNGTGTDVIAYTCIGRT